MRARMFPAAKCVAASIMRLIGRRMPASAMTQATMKASNETTATINRAWFILFSAAAVSSFRDTPTSTERSAPEDSRRLGEATTHTRSAFSEAIRACPPLVPRCCASL